MIVAGAMMMEGDLQAMDRMLDLTDELDRYHGFARPRLAPPGGAGVAPPRNVAVAHNAVGARWNDTEIFLLAKP